MTLPVSSYEELLARVRSLTVETFQLQKELSMSIHNDSKLTVPDYDTNFISNSTYSTYLLNTTCTLPCNDKVMPASEETGLRRPLPATNKKKDENDIEPKETDEIQISRDCRLYYDSFHKSNNNSEKLGFWHSGPSHMSLEQTLNNDSECQGFSNFFTTSMSLTDQSLPTFSSSRAYSHQQLGVKVEMVYNLLSMLGANNREDMSKTFLAMSSSPESCHAMRQSGCLPLLVQLVYSSELEAGVKSRASEALFNIVHAQTDEKRKRREIRVLKLLQQIREYCDGLKTALTHEHSTEESDDHPTAAAGALMKFSFDAEHRQAICILGGLHALTELLQVDHEAHGISGNTSCFTLRRFAGMSLTNLTFGDGKNKALLCGFKKFMNALVDQLKSPSEDLRQVTASLLRNLSWRADSESKEALRNVGAVTALTVAAMEGKKESTLKSILSALWNLSAHCSTNKADICCVPGALTFLVKMLKRKSSSNTLSIVENVGGIIRNISSQVALREDYRQILRDNNCFEILLEQLRSPSLTIVSNACGTLWNLSSRCEEDQKRLCEMGAANMLRNLIQSKHRMISMGASATLKNLLAANPAGTLMRPLDCTAKSLGFNNLPTLLVRKQRALEQEIDITLAETCDNIDTGEFSNASCTHLDKRDVDMEKGQNFITMRSDSKDSIRSSKSDSVCDRVVQMISEQENIKTEIGKHVLHESLNEKQAIQKAKDKNLIKRYKASMIPLPSLQKASAEKKFDTEDCILKKTNTTVNTANDASVNSVFRSCGGLVLKDTLKNITLGRDETTKKKIHTSGDTSHRSENHTVHDEKSSLSSTSRDMLSLPTRHGYNEPTVNYFSVVDIKMEDNHQCQNPYRLETDHQVPPSRDRTTKKSSDCVHPSESKEGNGLEARESIDNLFMKQSETENYRPSLMESPPLYFSQMETGIFNDKINVKSSIKNGADDVFNLNSLPLESEKTNSSFDDDVGCSKVISVLCNNFKNMSGDGTNFEIGSEVANRKFFQCEANKICLEIRKYQELDMMCSLNSEASLVSGSSFLDVGDHGLFDFTNDTEDFDESEGTFKDKFIKSSSYSLQIPSLSASNDFNGLPRLGSLRHDQVEAVDLDNSMISVASLDSEINEAEFKSDDVSGTSLARKFETPNDILGERVNSRVEQIKEKLECNDVDDSVNSQENSPFGTETQTKLKSKSRERRKTVKDRYRTYTIRDLKPDLASETNGEQKKSGTPSNQREFSDENNDTHSMSGELCCGSPVIESKSGNDTYHFEQPDCHSIHSNKNHSDGSTGGGIIENDTNHNILIHDLKDESHAGFDQLPSVHESSCHNQIPFILNEDDRQTNTCCNSSTFKDDSSVLRSSNRKELVENAKLVALSLKTAFQDTVGSMSDSEESSETQEIDTATYNKSYRKELEPPVYLENGLDECDSSREANRNGSRITDHQEIDNSVADNLSKAIRGRRKKLYPSQLRESSGDDARKPYQKSSHLKKHYLPIAKSLPNVRRSVLIGDIVPALQRQGTFTKDKSKFLVKPAVRSETAIPIVCAQVGPKVGSLPDKSVSSLRNSKAVAGVSKMYNRTPTKEVVGLDVNNAKPNYPERKMERWRACSCKEISNGLHVSHLKNCVSPVGAPNAKGIPKASKKEVTSKIAGLWKKIEETKQKNKNGNDHRIRIVAKKNLEADNEISALEQNISPISGGKPK